MYRYILNNLDATADFANKIAMRLAKGGILFLYGDLGSGKTALTKEVGLVLGIKEKIKSPTYTLMQEYLLPSGFKFYHLDLYRLENMEDVFSLGYEEIIANPENLVVIEWADRINDLDKPKKRLDLFLEVLDQTKRQVKLNFVRENLINRKGILKLFNEFQTPKNVRAHCEMVTSVALELAERLIQNNEIVDVQLLYEGAMLHDLVRLVDFSEFKKENFLEELTDAKWSFWQNLRKRFMGLSHAHAAQIILLEKGYSEVASLIRKHCTSCILQKKRTEELITWEDKLLYYADKRVKHNQIVSTEERFRIGRAQNGHLIKSLAESVEIEAKANELEREIFNQIQFNPREYKFKLER